MSVERSTKRRKLNPTPTTTPDQTRSSKRPNGEQVSKQSQQSSTPNRSAVSSKATVAQDVVKQKRATAGNENTPGSLQRKTPASKAKPAEVEDGPDDGSDSAEEEITVRSSGRVRRLPAKLKEDEDIPVPRGRNKASSRGETTTTALPKRRTKTAGLNEADTAHDTPMAEITEPVSSPAPSTAKRKRIVKTGKENVTPSVSASRAASETVTSTPGVPDSIDLTVSRPSRKQKQTVPPRAASSRPVTIEAEEVAASGITTDERIISSEVLQTVQMELLARTSGRQTIPQVDREEEYTKVASLVRQAVEAGESNSMLLIGPRGTGKTALSNQILQAQQSTHADDFHVVRLNGFIHTDDKLALRDIWRQLGREMELEDKETDVRSYADTLSMLLALLSRPQELDSNTSAEHVTKSVVFIIDEFDLFATHPRQTLLYNLFDIAQSRKAPIAVLGLTTRVDVVESLEKRVKSRFSHRYVHLAPARSLAAFTKICKATLSSAGDVADTWNATVEFLFASDYFSLHIRKLYYRSKSIPDFLTTMLVPLSLMPVKESTVSEIVEHFQSTMSMSSLAPDSKLDLLSSLSTLQLALLICAARQNAIYATENVTFNLAYEEYKAIAGKAKLQATASGALGAGSRVWGKDVAKNAWADLTDVGLIMEDGRGIGKVDIALEEIAGSSVELGQWARWCKEI